MLGRIYAQIEKIAKKLKGSQTFKHYCITFWSIVQDTFCHRVVKKRLIQAIFPESIVTSSNCLFYSTNNPEPLKH